MNATVLASALSFADVYGPAHAYAPRAHDRACDWISRDPMLLDSITGNQLPVLGAMPLVCSEGFNSPDGLELLVEAGLEPAATRFHYTAGGSVAAAKQAARLTRGKLVVQHVYPADELPTGTEWIAPDLLRYLNNKAKLAELTPAGHVPPRRIVDRATFFVQQPPALPVVLKAVTEQSTGGGAAVMICRTQADLATAALTFAQCEQLVIEELLDILRNPCLHFAVMPSGRVKYLGFAEQDVTENGKYRGNWIELDATLPREVVNIAQEVLQRAADLGYRGIAGVDMVVTRDGLIYVLDLNFRVNGSTAAVMLVPALLEDRGNQIAHLRSFKGKMTASAMVAAARSAVHRGQLVPMSLFDPILAGYSNQPPVLRAMVIGLSNDEVLAIEAELTASGLS